MRDRVWATIRIVDYKAIGVGGHLMQQDAADRVVTPPPIRVESTAMQGAA